MTVDEAVETLATVLRRERDNLPEDLERNLHLCVDAMGDSHQMVLVFALGEDAPRLLHELADRLEADPPA